MTSHRSYVYAQKTSMQLLVVPVLLMCVWVSSATLGIDVSSYVRVDQARCLVGDQDQRFAIVRAYHSSGYPDKNVGPTVANLWAGGFSHVDIYMFPCPKCKITPKSQIDQLVGAVKDVKFGMLWLDIEGYSSYWHSSQAENQKFFTELLDAAKVHFNVGVYASKNSWDQIMGNFNGGSAHPLWYPHYDGNPSYSDFQPFGGWTAPAMKQFNDNGSLCGVSYDKNWY